MRPAPRFVVAAQVAPRHRKQRRYVVAAEGLVDAAGEAVTVPAPTSPDCEQRKHTACSGDAWDLLADAPAVDRSEMIRRLLSEALTARVT